MCFNPAPPSCQLASVANALLSGFWHSKEEHFDSKVCICQPHPLKYLCHWALLNSEHICCKKDFGNRKHAHMLWLPRERHVCTKKRHPQTKEGQVKAFIQHRRKDRGLVSATCPHVVRDEHSRLLLRKCSALVSW